MSDPTDRWRELDRIFSGLLDLAPEERPDALEGACRDHPHHRAELEALLRSVETDADFLESPLDALPTDLLEELATGAGGDHDLTGRRVGAYRVVEVLDRGGMGTVYLAERADGQFEQRVALKVLRRGLDTDDVLRRFLAERQILASMQHPAIARLLDGGATDDGRPYLVMEYVEGEPVDAWCDSRGLGIEARLRLFLSVARAVQHAHRNLVLHRDIKPSNILVTAEGRVKLLDFGIAKLLDDPWDVGAPRTRTGLRLMTPRFASPEQIRGDPTTAASDVYQLGLLLHHLLTGALPYDLDDRSRTEAERTILEAEPTRPSAAVTTSSGGPPGEPDRLRKRLAGDLDTIVLKALRKEPDRRYASAEQMAEDVERHLSHRPVLARPDTWGYRTRKFLRRHPWVAPAAAALVVATLGYGTILLRSARALERERNAALIETRKAEEVRDFLVGFFGSPDPFRVDAAVFEYPDVSVREALDAGVDRVRAELADRPALRAAMLGTIAEVYGNIGLPERAEPLQREALALEERRTGPRSLEVAAALRKLGTHLSDQDRYDEAEPYLVRAVAVARDHGPEGVAETGRALEALGNLYMGVGDQERAGEVLAEAVSLYRAAGPGHERDLATSLALLAQQRARMARAGEAAVLAREGMEIAEAAWGPEHPRTAIALEMLAKALESTGDLEGAEAAHRRALAIFETKLGPRHDYTTATLNNLAVVVFGRGDHAEAELVHRRLLELRIAKHGERHADVASSLQNLAAAVNSQGRHAEAEELCRRAHEVFMETLGPEHFHTALPLLTLAEIQLGREAWTEAARTTARAVELLMGSLPEGHPITAVAVGRRGHALLGQGRVAEAEALLLESYETLAEARTMQGYMTEMSEGLVRLYEETDRPARAEPYRSDAGD